MKEYISLEEAAVLLSLSADEVNELIGQGEVTAYRIGGQFLRLKREEIESYMIRRRTMQSSGTSDKDKKKRLAAAVDSKKGIGDFFYFNDFYLLSLILCGILIYFILKLQF